MPTPHPPGSRRLARRPRVALALGLTTSLAVGWMGTQAERQRSQERLYREVDTATRDLMGEFDRYTALLQAMAAHLEVRQPANDREYQEFIDRLNVKVRYPGLLATNVGILLSPAQVPAFVASAKADRTLRPGGNPTFEVHPVPNPMDPDPIHLVRYVSPLEGNELALGFNSYANPNQREALDRALGTGLMSATGPISLVQTPGDQRGLIVRMPILRSGLPVRTREERMKAAWGTVNAVWIPELALAPHLQTLVTLQVQMVDTGWVDDPRPPASFLGPTLAAEDPMVVRRPVSFAGRNLELRFKPQPGHAALAIPKIPWALAGLVALLAVVGSRLLQIVLEREASAQAMARQLKAEAEAAAEAREREFEAFFEGAPIPIAITRMEDGTILRANTSVRALLELPRDTQPLGSALAFYRDPSQREKLLETLHQEGSVRGMEVLVRSASGRELDLLVSSERMTFGGAPVLFNVFLDLTEQRRSEAALRQAQKLESMGLLAGGIAHDFNNLLTAVQGNLDLARTVPPDRVPARLDAAEFAVKRATDLTRQLLAYSGRVPVQREALDLSSLVHDMATLLQVSIPKAVNLEMDLPEGLPAIIGDRTQLQQAVMNLVTNAADAIGIHGGTIHLRTFLRDLSPEELAAAWADQGLQPRPHLLLSVQDDGSGMDGAVRSRIFDPFFSTKEQGRGLGLSALLGILRAHHGGLRIDSEVGKGSTFTLALPATEAKLARPEPSPEPPSRFQGVALVVDDEASVRASASAMLESLGFSVHMADGGATGLAQARALAPGLSLVLLDLTMPPPDGRETYAALRNMQPALPIILSSGYTNAAPGALGKDPHLDFLPKPYTLRELRAAVAKRLGAQPGPELR